jgi:hypothetical protein
LLRAVEDHPDLEARIAAIRLLSLNHQAEVVPALRHLALNDSLPIEVQSALLAAVYPINQRPLSVDSPAHLSNQSQANGDGQSAPKSGRRERKKVGNQQATPPSSKDAQIV